MIEKIYSFLAVFGTPLAPAIIMMTGMYDGIIAMNGVFLVALLGAVLSGAGLEATGALASKMTVRAIKDRDWTALFFAVLGVIGYAAFAYTGIHLIPNSGVFGAMIMMSVVAYLVYGIYSYFVDKDTRALVNVQASGELTQNQIALLEAQTKLQRAQNRAAKLTGGQAAPVQPVHRTAGQALDPAKLAATIEYLKSQPDPAAVSVRDLEAANLGYKKSVAAQYKSAALDGMKK